MNAITPITTEETALSFVADPKVAIAVLTKSDERQAFMANVKADVAKFVPDLSTAKGREAIKAMAFKVTKTKTFIDGTRKALTEEHRKAVEAVNSVGRVVWDELESLAIETRKPLTDYEQAEKDRLAEVAGRFELIERHQMLSVEDSALTVSARILHLQEMTFDPAVFGDSLASAEEARDAAVATLQAAHARIVQEEADRAELALLRQAEIDRQADADRATKEAADALAETNRLAEIERQAQARADQAIADAETARIAEAKRIQEEADAREKDRSHRGKIMGAAKTAIMAHGGIDAETAAKIVKAIVAKAIPNISISF
jgi:colicin import membrane protein